MFTIINCTPYTLNNVACPKFEHPALSSEFLIYALNTEFVAALGKNKITIQKLKQFQS